MALKTEGTKLKAIGFLYILNNLLNPKQIQKNIKLINDFNKIVSKKKINFIEPKKNKNALILCYPNINSILIQSFFLISLRMKGYELIG